MSHWLWILYDDVTCKLESRLDVYFQIPRNRSAFTVGEGLEFTLAIVPWSEDLLVLGPCIKKIPHRLFGKRTEKVCTCRSPRTHGYRVHPSCLSHGFQELEKAVPICRFVSILASYRPMGSKIALYCTIQHSRAIKMHPKWDLNSKDEKTRANVLTDTNFLICFIYCMIYCMMIVTAFHN